MINQYVGRKLELNKLESLWDKKTPSLVVIKGRRRIGKSRLIQEFSKKYKLLLMVGLPPSGHETRQSQIDFFMKEMCRQTNLPEFTVDDWMKAFQLLASQLQDEKTVIALDEISWMGSKDPEFIGKLKTAWDLYFKSSSKLVFILSGSVSTWIDENIVSSTGFLGRLSLNIDLKELSLSESIQMLKNQNVKESAYNYYKLLSITGGVPRYLEEIQGGRTVESNIQNLCFSSSGILFDEFENIFSDLFDRRKELYRKIVILLARGAKDQIELCEKLGIKVGGDISAYLRHLIESGFVERDYTWNLLDGKTSKLSRYRISDNYLRFYLHYILPNKKAISNGLFDGGAINQLPGYDGIMGLQFENLILNNRELIWKKLNLSKEEIKSDGAFFQRKTQRNKGCQVDYLIQTKYNTLFACEIKYTKKPVSLDIVHEVEEKTSRVLAPKNFSKRIVLIHTHDEPENIQGQKFHWSVINALSLLEECDVFSS
jgi:AAA+ ATPase superfamily predicted ATPase